MIKKHNFPIKFDNIIRNNGEFIGNKIYQELSNYSDIRVLDLGCRVPVNLMNLYHSKLDCSLLLGLDELKDEIACVIEHINWLESHSLASEILRNNFYETEDHTFYNFYKVFLKSPIKPILPEKFKRQITDHYLFDTKIETYIEEYNEKFDLVICKNILHFTDQGNITLDKIRNLLSERGIIYIRIENLRDKTNNYTETKFKEEIDKNFQIGDLYYEYKDNVWHSVEFVNRNL